LLADTKRTLPPLTIGTHPVVSRIAECDNGSAAHRCDDLPCRETVLFRSLVFIWSDKPRSAAQVGLTADAGVAAVFGSMPVEFLTAKLAMTHPVPPSDKLPLAEQLDEAQETSATEVPDPTAASSNGAAFATNSLKQRSSSSSTEVASFRKSSSKTELPLVDVQIDGGTGPSGKQSVDSSTGTPGVFPTPIKAVIFAFVGKTKTIH